MEWLTAVEIALEVIEIAGMIVQAIDVDADGETPIMWGQIVSGTANLYYYDDNGARTVETGHYYFSSNVTDGYPIFDSEHVKVYAVKTGSSGNAPRIDVWTNQSSGNPIYGWDGGDYFTQSVEINGISAGTRGREIAIYSAASSYPSFSFDGTGGGNYSWYYQLGSNAQTILSTKSGTTAQVYLPSLAGQQKSFNDVRTDIINYLNTQISTGETLNPDDLPDWKDITGETEEETGGGSCGCGDTFITVNADGSLTLNNDISGDMPINIDNNADLSLSINAAAGAFGAGSIVVDPDANINLNAGAFGAGAFGAGAITGDFNFSGDVTFEQSGEITNNYYYLADPTEETEQPFTIDYNEILSEGELESILNQETYELLPIQTEEFTDLEIVESLPGTIQNLPSEVVATSNQAVNYGSQIVSELGLAPIYAPLLVFSFTCFVLRGCA